MKLISLIFGLLFLATTVQGQAASFVLGTGTHDISGAASDKNLDTANKWSAFGVLSPDSKTTSEISIYVSSITGAPGATDGRIDIYDNSSGKPGTSLVNATFDPGSVGWKRVSLSQALVAGTQYWFVVRNLAAVPGTDYFSLRVMPDGLTNTGQGGVSIANFGIGLHFVFSSDGGTTWTSDYRNAAAMYRIKWSDNTYYGFPAQNFDSATVPVAAADRIYSTREVGNRFTTPAGADLNIRCIVFHVAKTGTPTGFLRFRLYAGTTLVATTAALPTVASVNDQGYMPLCFTTAQTLTASTSYRAVISESTQSDASSDAYCPSRVDWDTDANSLPLKLFNGTMQKTICTGSCSGGSWADTPGSFYPMQLVLDFGNEFAGATPPSAGGLMNQYPMYGGMQ